MHYSGSGDLEKTTMRIEKITIKNITSTGHDYNGAFNCDSDSPCRDIDISDVHMDQKSDEWTCHGGDCCSHVSGATKDVTPDLDCFDKSAPI